MEKDDMKMSNLDFEYKFRHEGDVSDLRYKITVTDDVVIRDFTLKEKDYKKPKRDYDIEVYECNFMGDFYLIDTNIDNSIRFVDCNFEGNVMIMDSAIYGVEFHQCTFLKLDIADSKLVKLNVDSTKCERIHLSSFIESIELYNATITEVVLFKNDYGDLSINKTAISNIYKNFEEGLGNWDEQIYSNSESNEDKRTLTFKDVTIKFGGIDLTLVLNKIKVKKLELSGQLTKESSLFLKDVYVENFLMNNVQNDGKIRLHNIRLANKGVGKIKDSQLSKTEFSSVNFGQLNDFQIYLSNLTEILTTNTTFPKNIYGRSNKDYLETREVYRQLKFAASKQGDRIKELEYEKYEMINYEKTLSGWMDLKDIIILSTNRMTNNHGQDYTLTLFWFVPLTLVLFTLIKINLGYSFEWGVPRANDVSQYLEAALNPLHDFNKVFNDTLVEPVGKARLCDSLLKLISGYLIFQFLRAFRKYVK